MAHCEDVMSNDSQPITILAEHLFRLAAHHEHACRVSTYLGALGPGRLRKLRWLSDLELQIGSCPVPFGAPIRDVSKRTRIKLGGDRVVSKSIAWLLVYIQQPERGLVCPIPHQTPI